jgi:hypothetical protein
VCVGRGLQECKDNWVVRNSGPGVRTLQLTTSKGSSFATIADARFPPWPSNTPQKRVSCCWAAFEVCSVGGAALALSLALY